MSIKSTIEKNLNALTSKSQIAAIHISEILEQIPFLTVRQVSAGAGVSTLTVIRTVRDLGYSGYREFQHAIRHEVFPHDDDKRNPPESSASTDQVNQAAALITAARRVYVIGSRSAYSFAHYTVYMARMVFDNFHLIAPSGANDAEDIAQMSSDDVIIAFSSRPYSIETVRLVEAAHQLNIKSVAITDRANSPLAKFAAVSVIVNIERGRHLYRMGAFFSAIEDVLETSFDQPNTKAAQRIKYFSARVDAIRGYWR